MLVWSSVYWLRNSRSSCWILMKVAVVNFSANLPLGRGSPGGDRIFYQKFWPGTELQWYDQIQYVRATRFTVSHPPQPLLPITMLKLFYLELQNYQSVGLLKNLWMNFKKFWELIWLDRNSACMWSVSVWVGLFSSQLVNVVCFIKFIESTLFIASSCPPKQQLSLVLFTFSSEFLSFSHKPISLLFYFTLFTALSLLVWWLEGYAG